MNEELQTKAAEMLDAMAAKMGVAVDHFWPVLVRQQVIEGVWFFASFFIAIVGCGSVGWYCIRQENKRNDPWGPIQSVYAVPGIIFTALAFVLLVPAIVEGVGALTQIVNPEYAALMDILGR